MSHFLSEVLAKINKYIFFRIERLFVFDSTIQDYRGTSHVEKIVRTDWRSKWQEVARLNDDAIDGIIFLKRGRKPTSAIAFAQVKCGPGYRKDVQIRPNHIGVQVGAQYIEDHLPRWRALAFPVVMVYVDPSSNPKEPEAWWADLKSSESYTSDNKSIILLPKQQKFGSHSKGEFFKLCGPRVHYQKLTNLKFTSNELKLGALSESLKTNARNYYTHWKNGSLLDRTNPDLGEIIVNRIGWRHITRRERLSLAVSQSFQLLPVAARIIREVTPAKTLRAWVEKVIDQERIFDDLLCLDAQVYFPHRQRTVVRVVLRRRRTFNDITGTSDSRIWFYSVFEMHTKY
jgi:hypothetical protein